MKRMIFLTAWAVLAGQVLLAGPEKWTIDEIMNLKQIESPAISPDGRHVLYLLSGSAAAENRRYADLHVVTADGRATYRLTQDGALKTSPQWAPDSTRIAYLAADRRGKNQVWVTPATGGKPAQSTASEHGVVAFLWSPDGSRLLYAASEPKPSEQLAREKEWGVVISPEEEWSARAGLWLLELKSKKHRRVAAGILLSESPRWSPDGRFVAFLLSAGERQPAALYIAPADGSAPPRLASPPGALVHSFAWSPDGKTIGCVLSREESPAYVNYFKRQIYFALSRVWLLDPASGRSRFLLSDEYPGLSTLLWSRDGRKLAFLSKPPGIKNDASTLDVLHVASVADGTVRTLAPGFDFLRGGIGLAWSRGNEELWFLNGERMGYNVFAADVATGKLRHVTSGQDTISSVSYSADFSAAAFVRENANTKPDIHLAKLPGWSPAKITDINPQVGRFAHGPAEIIKYASEGREIEALLIKPPDFDKAKKYPLLLVVHGGPTWYKKNDWCHEWEFHPVQAYAAAGYCLVFPNVRGSADYGLEFRRANYADLGGGDYRDAIAAVDYLIGQGFIDENAMGVTGWSYGGFLTPAIIGQTTRFKAAQFGAGIPSFEAMYSRLSTVEFIVHENYGPRPWEDPQMHVRSSPLYWAKNVKTPTLIEHGEDDPRCPVGGAVLFYKALKFYGVPAVLEIYPKEGHGITGPLLHRRVLRRNLEWFNKWLKGDRTTSFEKLFPAAAPGR